WSVPKGLSSWAIKYLTKSQLLLCGGHILLPAVKWMHDHRQRLEFSIGHKLDLAQEFFCHGNEASHRNLKDYERLNDLRETAKQNQKQGNLTPVPLNDDDKKLLARNHVDAQLQFVEDPTTWGRVIKARLMGMLGSVIVSMGMALTSQKWLPENWR